MALQITKVAGVDVEMPTDPGKIPKVHVSSDQRDSKGTLTVSGTGLTTKGGVVCCILTRLGKSLKEKRETIRTVVRFGTCPPGKRGDWSVVFPIDPEAACFLIAAHTHPEHYYVEATVDKIKDKDPGRLAFTDHDFTKMAITAKGTVLIPGNPVSCTLTPVDCTTGTYPPPGGNPPPIQVKPATFNPPGGTAWSVSFTPLPPATTFPSGCYVVEATAASEGTISVQGSV